MLNPINYDHDHRKKAMLETLANLYNDIEEGKADITEFSVNFGTIDSSMYGDPWKSHVSSGRQTINMIIERVV